ncbi:MAG: AAA family ATPase, partial [Dehalococcoidia bacterium]
MTSASKRGLKLTAAEALPKDVGRGIARLDPEDMSRVGVQVGDIVQIAGKRATAAKVMPTYSEDRGKGIAQIDGIMRENAQAGLGEQVGIEGAAFEEASAVVLAPATSSRAFVPGRDSRYLGRVLEGLPLIQGDRIRATLFGSRYQEFSVVDTDPGGVVAIGPRTLIKVKGESTPTREKSGVTYEDIGGLRKEIHR